MKHQFTLTIITALLFLASCKKDAQQKQDDYLGRVETGLKDSLSTSVYSKLDFAISIIYKVDSVQLYFVRVPFSGKKIQNDFLLVRTDKAGSIQRGKIIHLEGKETDFGQGKVKAQRFDGIITISSLDETNVIHSPITNGYIEAFHKKSILARESSMQDPSDELPEVVVTAYVNNAGISYSDWYYFMHFIPDGGGGGDSYSGGYYGPAIPGDGGGGGGGSSNGGGSGSQKPPILVDVEAQDKNDAIDITKFMNCFGSIPDAGATCSIEILTDIPVDGDPSKFFNWTNNSPGHTFIKLNKNNGSQSVQQIFGWYPKQGYHLLLTTAPVEGKFVNNENHEYNASLKMNITPDQLHSAINEVLYLARFIKYDIDEYNCTDFALEVFNHTVAPVDELEIQRYDIPGGTNPYGTNTPNGLYLKLQNMKSSGGPRANDITIPGIKGWVGSSNGLCN